ncbi:Spore maturation protein CgeB [Methylobacterium phyllostachyos]|uniref:Spore maturation protein CgeB n=1 Tax=Methylobacterium phyllostachyos TaxID=582672 RepID=A0A1H0DI44_9HYPH|nr:glycosyltransferase [Methylobacterium phyllostachyos]SDN69947.1 Spore maturation protein CgeB [Methylobacterium phyllostachyos]
MRIAYFTHSLASCWNHGNAHFLRGVLRELMASGHAVAAYEPEGAWSLENLLRDHGEAGLDAYQSAYPELASARYAAIDAVVERVSDSDLVLVHEWSEPALVAALGAARRRGARYTLLFHDTHHRAVSAPEEMERFNLSGYDGVLAFGETLAAVYRAQGWGRRAFVWHEAADTRLFRPPADELPDLTHTLPPPSAGEGTLRSRGGEGSDVSSRGSPDVQAEPFSAPSLPSPDPLRGPPSPAEGGGSARSPARAGLIWIGNWGDDERSAELETYLFRPAAQVGLPLDIYGVRYPAAALATLKRTGARYHGWAANAAAPGLFARHLATVHVPRRFYVERLPGIPTIRVFEALACGIPLVCAPWDDSESLFRPGRDYLVARTGADMEGHLRALQADAGLRQALAASGLATIRARHTCAHRAEELLTIAESLRAPATLEATA